MIRLLVQQHPAHPGDVTERGRRLTPARPAYVKVMAVPATAWASTDPDALDAAAADLTAAATWLRTQQGGAS